MAKRKRMPTDVNQRAKAVVDFATSDEPVTADEKNAERYPWSLTQIAELLD